MFLPHLEPGTARQHLDRQHARLYELMNELGTAIAHRRMAFADGQDARAESDLVSSALKEIIEVSLAVDVVMAVEHQQLHPEKGLLSPIVLEQLLPYPALVWNDVLLALKRVEEWRAEGHVPSPSPH